MCVCSVSPLGHRVEPPRPSGWRGFTCLCASAGSHNGLRPAWAGVQPKASGSHDQVVDPSRGIGLPRPSESLSAWTPPTLSRSTRRCSAWLTSGRGRASNVTASSVLPRSSAAGRCRAPQGAAAVRHLVHLDPRGRSARRLAQVPWPATPRLMDRQEVLRAVAGPAADVARSMFRLRTTSIRAWKNQTTGGKIQ